MKEEQANKTKARILIIEDSSAIQKLTKKVITFQEDYEVVFALDGEKALNIIESSEPFDVILSDMDMPVKRGEQFIKEMRELDDPIKAKVPVIACTGNQNNLEEKTFEEMGFNGLFNKPINYQNLMLKIKPLLEKKAHG